MRKSSWSSWLSAIVGVALVVAVAPVAQAACGGGATTFGAGAGGSYNYVTSPAGAAHPIGLFWEPGKRVVGPGGQDNGSVPTGAHWSLVGQGPNQFFKYWNLGDPNVDGCPGGPAVIGGDATGDEAIIVELDKEADESNAYYYVERPSFNLQDSPQFNMAPAGVQQCPNWTPFDMQPIPRLVVNLSSRVNATSVALNVCLASTSLGFQGATAPPGCAAKDHAATITGYRICQFQGDNDPGRNAIAWDCGPSAPVIPTIPGTGQACGSFQTTCPTPTSDRRFATQLIIDGGTAAGGYETEYVSRSVRLECDPHLAEPEIDQDLERPRPRPTQTRPSKSRVH